MDTRFTMCKLFENLGMPCGTEDVEIFFDTHHLRADTPLLEAGFWNEQQLQFLGKAMTTPPGNSEMAGWHDYVRELQARLRH